MAEFFIDVGTGQVALRRQLVEAGVVAPDVDPALPWHRVQGPGDASTMWYAVMRKRTRGVFIGTLTLRHGERFASLLEEGWEEVAIQDIGASLS